MSAVMASIVQSTDARTRDGKRARIWERSLRRAHEDLDDLNGVAP